MNNFALFRRSYSSYLQFIKTEVIFNIGLPKPGRKAEAAVHVVANTRGHYVTEPLDTRPRPTNRAITTFLSGLMPRHMSRGVLKRSETRRTC
jgi:hypothetical protein